MLVVLWICAAELSSTKNILLFNINLELFLLVCVQMLKKRSQKYITCVCLLSLSF